MILSARSSYFQKLFHSNFNEQFQNEIDLSSFLSNDNDFHLLHSYLYKAESHLTSDNIFQYIQLSDRFLLDDLYELCEEYLLIDNHINENNVLECSGYLQYYWTKNFDVYSREMFLVF